MSLYTTLSCISIKDMSCDRGLDFGDDLMPYQYTGMLCLRRSKEPFKGCWYYCEDALGSRLDSMGSLYDYDEEDMTWVEYQWLARRNPQSPRMVRCSVA